MYLFYLCIQLYRYPYMSMCYLQISVPGLHSIQIQNLLVPLVTRKQVPRNTKEHQGTPRNTKEHLSSTTTVPYKLQATASANTSTSTSTVTTNMNGRKSGVQVHLAFWYTPIEYDIYNFCGSQCNFSSLVPPPPFWLHAISFPLY